MAKLDQTKTPFYDKIKSYGQSHTVALDVPGHKLGRIQNDFRNYVGEHLFLLDANAPRGLDNLSKPKGVIKEAQVLAADAFGADHAYFFNEWYLTRYYGNDYDSLSCQRKDYYT